MFMHHLPVEKSVTSIALLRPRFRKTVRVFSVVTAIGLMLAGSSRAADSTWVGNGADGSWLNVNNWLGGIIPGAVGTLTNADIATFDSAATQTTILVDLDRNLRSLVFNTATAAAFTFSGSPLHLSSGGSLTINSTVVNAQTFNSDLVLEPATNSTAGNYSFTNSSTNAAARFLMAGNISGGTTTEGVILTLGGSNTGSNTVTGIISNGGAAGGLAITKSGGGNWFLSGANTYTGVTTVNAGILVVTDASALGASGAGSGSVVNSGGSLSLSGGITIANEAVTVNGHGVNSTGALRNSAGNNIWAGTVTLGASAGTDPSLTVNAPRIGSAGGNINVSGVIQDGSAANNRVAIRSADSGGNPSGSVTFSGANTYTGTTHIVVGALTVSSINSVTTDVGLGTVHSSSSNLGAPTTVANGTIYFSSGTAVTGRLVYNGTGETTDRNIVLNGSTSGATLDQSGASGHLKFLGTVSAPGSTGDQRKTLILQGSTAGTAEIAGVISDSVLGVAGQLSTSVTKTGSGTWTLSGANTYTGATTITGGTLSVSSINSVVGGTASSSLGAPITQTTGTISMGTGGTTGSTLLYTGSGEITDRVINLAGTTGGATLNQSGAGLLKLTSNFTATGAGTKTLALTGSTAGTGEIAGTIVDNSAVNKTNLSKQGTGTWTLSAANSYTGTTTVVGGVLSLTAAGAITNSAISLTGGNTTQNVANAITGTSALTINSAAVTQTFDFANNYTGATTVTNGTLQTTAANVLSSSSAVAMGSAATAVLNLNGFNQTIGSLSGGGSSGGNVNLGSAALTLGGDNTVTATYIGSITGTGSVIKVGTGTQVIGGGVNTFSGGLIIKSGTLEARAPAGTSLGASPVTLGDTSGTADASLTLGSSTANFAQAVNVIAGSTGVLTISNSTTVTATVTLSGAVNLSRDVVLATASVGGFTASGAISGSGNITLRNTSTTTGPARDVTLSGTINNAGTITNSSASTNAAGGAVISGALGPNVTSVIQDSATTKLTISGANPLFAGSVLVNAGTVAVTGATSLKGNNVVSVASAGTFDLGNSITIAGLQNVSGTGGIVTASTPARVLTLGGSGSYTFGGTLTSANLSLNVAMTGSGVQTLTGANTYTGNTTVNLGTLAIASGGSLGATAITVGSGATPVSNVSGNGTLNIRGNVTLGTASAGTLTINGGVTSGTLIGQGTLSLQDTTVNTLTLANTSGGNNLVLGGPAGNASIISMDVGENTVDLIQVGQGVLLNAGGAIVNLNQLAGNPLAASTYTLMTYSGLTGAGSFVLGDAPALPAGKFGRYELITNATSLQVNFSGLVDTASTAYWTGEVNSVWNTYSGGVSNFRDDALGTNSVPPPGSNTDVYFTANTAGNLTTTLGQSFAINSLNFTGTGTPATSTVTIGGGSTLTLLAAGGTGLTVDANSGNHVISAPVALGANQTWALSGTSAQTLTVSGNLSGNFNLNVTGARKLILAGTNSYGGTVINSGSSVQVGAGGGSGTLGTGTVTNNGILTIDRTGTFDITGAISGSGTLTKLGSGTVNVSSANSYGGLTTISAGILNIQNSTALGSGAAGTVVNGSGVLTLQGGIAVSGESLSITNAASDRSVIENVSGNNTWTGNITAIQTTTTRIVSNSGNLLIDGNYTVTSGNALFVLQGSGNGEIRGNLTTLGGLTKSSMGAGTWILSGTNSIAGGTAVSNGTLQLGNGGTTGSISTNSAISIGTTGSGMAFAINRSNDTVQGGDFSGAAISGLGQFRQIGTGVTTLNAANTYSGGTSVTAGTLLVKNTAGSATGTGDVTINLAGTLAGNGTLGDVTKTVFMNGALTVGDLTGDTTGNLNVAGAMTMGAASSTTLEIQGINPGEYDRLLVATTLTLDGTINLNFAALDQSLYENSFALDLFDWANVVSTNFNVSDINFQNVNNGDNIGYWDTSEFLNSGLAGGVIYWQAGVVPEPGRMLLLMLGVVGLVVRRRR